MSGKRGVILGVLGGMAIGLAGVLVTMHLMSDNLVEKQKDAYDQGLRKGLELATDEATGKEIGAKFNQGLMDENKALADQLGTARTRLEAFQSRDDLTPQAKDDLALILEGMK